MAIPAKNCQGAVYQQASLWSPFVSRSARLLSLLQALRGRRYPVTATELARTLEVSERTIYRDVANLAEATFRNTIRDAK